MRCLNCNREFEPRHEGQKYCCRNCSVKYRRRMKRKGAQNECRTRKR